MRAQSGSSFTHAAPESIPGYDVAQALVALSGDPGIWRGRARRMADGMEVTLTAVSLADRSQRPPHSDEGALALAARLSRIRHAHLARIHDVVPGADVSGEQEYVALATSVLEGGLLTTLIARRGSLSLGELITLVCPLAEALQHVHLSGAVHGRLTTEAVWLTDQGMPLLVDVGIDDIRGASAITRTGFEGCVAPEVLEGFAASPESDAYALAALAWQVLTGEPPGWVGVREDLSELAGDVTAPVCEMLTRALSPEPDERPQLGEMIREFRAAGTAMPIDIRDGDVGYDVPARIRAMATRRPSGHRAQVRRPRWVIGALVAGCVMFALMVLAWWVSGLLAASADPAASSRAGGTLTQSAPTSAATGAPTMAPDLPHPADLKTPASAGEGSRVIQEVLEARARAWESGDPTELGKAHAATSAALAADRSDLVAAAKLGTRYEGLAFVAEDVEILDVRSRQTQSTEKPTTHESPSEGSQGREDRIKGASEFTARVTVHRSPLTVTTRDGYEQRLDSSRETVTMTLRRGPAGWRLWAWR